MIEKGTGVLLGDYEFFTKNLEKVTGDSDVVKALNSVLFNRVGKKHETKKHLRSFSGIPDLNNKKKYLDKVLENKKKWTVSLLKDSLGLFGLEKSGTREELAGRMIDYLAKPSVLKSVSALSKSSKSKSKGSKRKRAGGKDDKPKKKKQAPSAYILYTSSIRAQTKEENPEADFVTLTKLLSEKWNSLDAPTKEVLVQLSS